MLWKVTRQLCLPRRKLTKKLQWPVEHPLHQRARHRRSGFRMNLGERPVNVLFEAYGGQYCASRKGMRNESADSRLHVATPYLERLLRWAKEDLY
jgi:hypothetical protein